VLLTGSSIGATTPCYQLLSTSVLTCFLRSLLLTFRVCRDLVLTLLLGILICEKALFKNDRL
jgi:hypothetical protein